MKFEINDWVMVESTDSALDGYMATVKGFHFPNGCIILFDIVPEDYNPAIVITENCLKKIK